MNIPAPSAAPGFRALILALAGTTLLAGCVTTAGYGYGDGYYRAPGTIQYRSNRGYPYGGYGYGGAYRYGYPYGYGPGYGYRYDRYYYGAPGYDYRPGYPHHGHHSDHDRPPSHGTRPPSNRPPSGRPPWRELDKLRSPTQGRPIAPPAAPVSRPPATVRPTAPVVRPPARAGEGSRKGRDYYKRGGIEPPVGD